MLILGYPDSMWRLSACILLVQSISACSSWFVQPTTPRDLIAGQHPQRLRITRTDSSHIVLTKPQIRGDSLYGSAEHGLRIGGSDRRSIVIPLPDVQEVAVRKFDGGKTAFAGAAVAGVAALIITMATLQGEE